MASGTIRDTPAGTYQVVYRIAPGAKQQTKTFRKKADARTFLNKQLGAAEGGTWIDPKGGAIHFKTFAEKWRLMQPHRITTATKVESNMRLHVYPAIGNRRLDSIRRSDLQELITNMALSPAAVEVVGAYIGAVFNAAVRDRLIAESPWQKIAMPEVSNGRVEVAPLAFVAAMEKAFPEHLRALIPFTAGSGLRQGEAFAVSTDRLNLEEGYVIVDRQLVSPNGTRPEFGPTKNSKKVPSRTVPLAPVVVDLLETHIKQFPPNEDGLIFSSVQKHRLRRSSFNDTWHRAMERADYADAGWTFHDLRHFYASLLIRHGASVKTVQTRLGHASPTETLKTYAHMWPDEDSVTRTAVEEVLSSRAEALPTPVETAEADTDTTADNGTQQSQAEAA